MASALAVKAAKRPCKLAWVKTSEFEGPLFQRVGLLKSERDVLVKEPHETSAHTVLVEFDPTDLFSDPYTPTADQLRGRRRCSAACAAGGQETNVRTSPLSEQLHQPNTSGDGSSNGSSDGGSSSINSSKGVRLLLTFAKLAI